MKNASSMILLIIVGLFLLMLAFSGRYKEIFTAAFPSLGAAGDSNVRSGDISSERSGGSVFTAYNNASNISPTRLPNTGVVLPP